MEASLRSVGEYTGHLQIVKQIVSDEYKSRAGMKRWLRGNSLIFLVYIVAQQRNSR